MYEVKFAASAAKEFRSLETQVKRRVATAVETLRQNPRPPGARKLRGHVNLYRIRVGTYRLVYEIDDQIQSIRITRVRHRKDAYR